MYGQTDDYLLLQRAIDEQTKKDDKGGRVPKNKEDWMAPGILQTHLTRMQPTEERRAISRKVVPI